MLFDLYVSERGWLHRLDPRTKIAMVLCGAVLFVAFNSVIMLAALLAAIHVGLLASHVPARQVWWVWRQLLQVLVIIVGLWPLFAGIPGPELFSLGPLSISVNSVLMGLATGLRVLGMSLLFFIILFTTQQRDLVRGLVKLGLPFEWGLALAIALRYIPTFTGMVAQVEDAQAARGWQVARGDVLGRLRGVIPVLTALIIGVLRTSDTLGMALAVRGVGSGHQRTVWQDIRLQRRDWVALALIVLVFAGLIYARFALGWGAKI